MPELSGYDPDQLRLPSGCFIGGAFVQGDGEEYDVVRPSDGHIARREKGASSALVDRAVTEAARAFKTSGWATSEPRSRGRALRRWADLVESNAEELARLESVVSSRIVSEARVRDVCMTCEVIRYYGELVDKIEGQVYASPPDVWSFLIREPYGVVAGISPWNVPLLLATIKLAPALAAGNAVVLKPSELTPYSVLRLAQLGHEAGLPPGQIAIIPGLGPETGSSLVKHPLVSYVSFTGSTTTGSRVMCDAAMNGLKPVALELGGKSPHLVFADVADLDKVAELVASGICRNAGQVCFAGTRLVVEEPIADQLTEKITKLIGRVKPGPTWDPTTTLAPLFQTNRLTASTTYCVVPRVRGRRSFQAGVVSKPRRRHLLSPDNRPECKARESGDPRRGVWSRFGGAAVREHGGRSHTRRSPDLRTCWGYSHKRHRQGIQSGAFHPSGYGLD